MIANSADRSAPAVLRLLRKRATAAIALTLALSLAVLTVSLQSPTPVLAADPAASVIAKYRTAIPELMAEQHVPGLAVALVDAERPLWIQAFGHLDGPVSAPVTPDTIFSVQSMSKVFTATAVVQAVAAGRLDLDEPITTYLPEFTVRSAFEAHPERKITLRTLLSHTAGFTHEAPVGNNHEVDPGDFEAHVSSISQTWLRFPVGSGYAYSNLGIDLAGYVLERVEGKPFAQVMKDSLLTPLGMQHSSFDRLAIRASVDRAVGHVEYYPQPPLDVPMTAAGGLYSSAADLARFLRFQLNDGVMNGRVVLDAHWLAEMRSVQGPRAGETAGWGLGIPVTRWNRWSQRPDLLNHGGDGFLSDLWWVPELGVGIAILTNSQDHQLQGDLALSILGDLVAEPGVYRDRLLSLASRPAVVDPNTSFEPPADMADLLARAAMVPTGDEEARWAACVGSFGAPTWGVIDPSKPAGRFFVDHGVPYVEINDSESAVRHRLVEVEPELFLADNGETLDMRGADPTWANLRLVRLAGGPAPWQWGVLAAASATAAAWLVAAAAGTIRRLRARAPSEREAVRGWRRSAATVATLSALIALGTVGLIAWMPALVDAGFLGWLELPIAFRLALHLPLALAVLGAATVVLAAAGWARRWWSRSLGLMYIALAVAVSALTVQAAAWRLIGWGLT